MLSTALQLRHRLDGGLRVRPHRVPRSRALFALYLATMMIPLQVIIVPLFIEMRNLHLVDTYAGLILPTIVS